MKRVRLDRRTFLRGAGAAVALPLLEAMLPSDRPGLLHGIARADGVPPPTRFITYFVPCGAVMNHWTPAVEGTAYELSPLLAPLAAHRAKLSVLTGLDNTSARRSIANAGPHTLGAGTITSAMPMNRLGATGPSIDRRAASAFGGSTRFRSLVINNEPPLIESDGEGVSTAIFHNFAWDGPGRFLPAITEPRSLFNALFQPGTDAAAARRRSVIDAVRDDANDLRQQLGVVDARVLDEYLDGVHELEQQLATGAAICAPPSMDGVPGDAASMSPPDRARLFARIIAAAFRCDLTRFVNFALANAGNRSPLPWLGITDGHHPISHRSDPTSLGQLDQIVQYEMGQLAYLLDQLASVPEGSGTMLDHTAVVLFSEVADGALHSYESLPVLVAGGGGGRLVSGRHLRYEAGTSIARLYATILAILGDPQPQFGLDGFAPLSELLV